MVDDMPASTFEVVFLLPLHCQLAVMNEKQPAKTREPPEVVQESQRIAEASGSVTLPRFSNQAFRMRRQRIEFGGR